ncbi:hypothetical protein E3T26_13925 [Cryobacterium sp. TMT1-21]|uniref:Uncharacterized protein n=1 Tax=Cryobacterium shii TaxID=1259235 RepID=A0AAQ2C511_9MICO|nr:MULTISPECIES: hypothetical protein [Cryobacterium]TFC43417.1 hypothetical protein E3O49_13225 [Cryobacterium shii]TFC89585.1 hypothetical protein E3T24_00755 [Cryobacterium sp. TmT2-59]TFD10459.1 hypothetical protein E3T26_13925 [Cryobacterium sp. TMT1-21]TFD14201.1 hypothetical protein E3T42_12045 [Cryobacterium sp. TMT4-10]TFD20217.1 hypothetical protein E3T32_09290 [Cryobacterium sp. TMT2-23]
MSASPQHPSLQFELPGAWWRIPVDSIDSAAASVKKLVAHKFGRNSSEATFRAQQRKAMSAAVTHAIEGGATEFHVSLKLDKRITFASTLTVYRPALTFPGQSTEPPVIMDALALGLVRGDGSDREDGADHWAVLEGEGAILFEKGRSYVLRRTSDHEQPGRGPDVESYTAIKADYWITVPGASAVLLVTFSSPLAELGPLLVELYDAIIDSAVWTGLPEAPAAGNLADELRTKARP